MGRIFGYFASELKIEKGRIIYSFTSEIAAVCGEAQYDLGIVTKENVTRLTRKIKTIEAKCIIPASRMLFSDFMLEWLEMIRLDIRLSTYSSYSNCIKTAIVPFFKQRGVRVEDLTAKDIQDFYLYQRRCGKSGGTIKKYHANLHSALKYALKMDIIDRNPMDKIDPPKKERFVGSYYSAEELNDLIQSVKGTNLEIPVMLAGFYGFRRGEISGLRWKAVDFDRKTITINHTISQPKVDGKTIINPEDNVKTKSSLRTLPLAESVEKKLFEHRAKQKEYRKFFKKEYYKDWLDYICLMPNGRLITPNYITSMFRKFLEENNFRAIRFHDLRHTCATLMQKNDIDINYIKEYLGHSDIATTANTYSHLDLEAMKKPVDKMSSILKL